MPKKAQRSTRSNKSTKHTSRSRNRRDDDNVLDSAKEAVENTWEKAKDIFK